jgi:alkanesulfonate monooxygenase SsuD/methylene tetrahydromethanopterin reductase-like flavin-dependent oxidoreductase (luciferase family)
MEVGVHLPQVATTTATPDVRRVTDVVDAARELGLAAVSANDHLAFHRPWLDGLTLLASVADRAGDLELATTVALPTLRGPAQLAGALATLATLAPGRVVAGVGPGSSAVDHALAGVPYDERWLRFEESVRVLRALLGRGSHARPGDHVHPDHVHPDQALPGDWVDRLGDARVVAPPAPVPVWLAGWGSPAGLRRVARLGDGWLASAYNTTPEAFADGRALLAEERHRLGRDDLPAALATMWTWIDDDEARAARVLEDVLVPLVRRDPAALRERVCVGTPAHCARLLSAYAAAGCARTYVWPLGDETDQLTRLVRDVLPLVPGHDG